MDDQQLMRTSLPVVEHGDAELVDMRAGLASSWDMQGKLDELLLSRDQGNTKRNMQTCMPNSGKRNQNWRLPVYDSLTRGMVLDGLRAKFVRAMEGEI